jgi:branched-chain amino acid transport system substrate-binding protein
VLREHDFRAGRFRVAFQSCDDSTARSAVYDDAKCASNARAYGANQDVVAVLAPLNSPCTVDALPDLNRARGGPVPTLSALNSFVGLTRKAPGVEPKLLADLYPTGRRNFLRVFPTDDLQGAALALTARERGRQRVYALADGKTGWGDLMSTGFVTAARRLGLTVVGRETWVPSARSYAGLARRVAASGAQAVFIGGLLDNHAGQVVRDLRAELDPDIDLMGPDGLTPLPLLMRSSGGAARGMLISLAGLLTDRLPPAGTEFVHRFAATQSGAEIEPSAVYAAQAAEVLLAAIARSDGTRESILEELFRTRVRDGLLGDFSFDRNGDVTESPVTILRVGSGGTGNQIMNVDGGEIERVVRPSSDLVSARP